jgi:NAD-dependent DNA ligase
MHMQVLTCLGSSSIVQAWNSSCKVRYELHSCAGLLGAQRDLILDYDAAYYSSDAPRVSDAEYDALKRNFQARLQNAVDAGIDTSGLEFSGVGAPVATGGGLAKAEHTAARGGRLLSLAAARDEGGVREWWRRNIAPFYTARGKEDKEIEVIVEPKVDGLTLRATYENGKCVQVCRLLGLSDATLPYPVQDP